MDSFKIEHAHEEIECFNIEIPRVVTYIWDEDMFLQKKEAEFQESDVGLAHQIVLYRMEQGRCAGLHMRQFQKLSWDPGFTGSIEPGISVETLGPSDDRNPVLVDMDKVAKSSGGMSDRTGDSFGRQQNISKATDGADGAAPSATMDGDRDQGDEEDEDQEDEDLSAIMFNVLCISTD